jgi:uncharacterized protein YndB with AHSA1/START domain
MKILLIVLLVLAIIIVIALIVAIFAKKDYSAEREIVINRPKQEVFNYIKYLKNQNEYSKWGKTDPNMKTTYSGADATVGFIFAWESDSKGVGKGSQEIKRIIDGERLESELRFAEHKTPSQNYMITETVSENVTKVKWGVAGRINYPMNLIMLFMNFEKMIGDDFGAGLTNLKTLMERQTETDK